MTGGGGLRRQPAPGAPASWAEDAGDAALEVERQRRRALAAAAEADERRRRAAAYAGGPLDPRAQGLWDAAAFHAVRARAAAVRLEELEALASAIRAGAEAARRRPPATVDQADAAGPTDPADPARPVEPVRPCA